MSVTMLDEISDLQSQTARLHQQKKTQALGRYVELIRRATTPQKGDAATVLDLAESLGLTTTDIASDIAALKRLRDAQAKSVDDELVHRLTDSYSKALADLAREEAAWEKKWDGLKNAVGDAQRARDNADANNKEAHIAAMNTRRSNPRLFGEFNAPVVVEEKPCTVYGKGYPIIQPPPANPTAMPSSSGFNSRDGWGVIGSGAVAAAEGE